MSEIAALNHYYVSSVVDNGTSGPDAQSVHARKSAAFNASTATAPCFFLGMAFSPMGFNEVLSALASRPGDRDFAYVATPNAQHATYLNRGDSRFVSGLGGAWFLTCDSRILKGLSRSLFGMRLPLVTGSDLTRRLFETVIGADDPVTVIGGDRTMQEILTRRFGLKNLNLYAPPMGFSACPKEVEKCADFVRRHPARFVFLACGAPQSEMLGAYIREQGGATGIGLCVGSSLSFLTGQRKRAPKLVQSVGLEWLHRLCQEPRRLGKRFFDAQLPVLSLALSTALLPSRCRSEVSSSSSWRATAAAASIAGNRGESSRERPDVSVVVVCYDRIALLERTLRACFAQQVSPGLSWEIVVADNHPDQLSEPLLNRLISPVPVVRVPAEPFRNIAAARNAGVAAARGRMIAFIDDDEAPDPDWLENHFACLQRTGADVSFGPKYPSFEGGKTPAWDPDGWYFTVDFRLPQDAEIRPLRWSPRSGRGLGTGNSMLRRETCLSSNLPFDEHYGRTGGEDTLLFFGLAKQNRRFVWCPSAGVREYNVADRLEPEYMLARLRRSAQHSATCRLALSQNRAFARATIFAIGTAQLAWHGLRYLLTPRADQVRALRHRFGVAKGLGKLGLAPAPDFIPEPFSQPRAV